MTPERWRQVEELFHAVEDDDVGPERDARLRALAADDALALEVIALLDADRALSTPRPASDRRVGMRVGNYRVGDLIARGGMASVYEGYRADDQFRQRVAIKVMDVRLSDRRLVEAFVNERQILANLEHVAITRLIDGGLTEPGEPYLVMEHVNGVPIDRYCDANGLDIHSRVRLFARACAGVDFAHRNLILHRDLKPSNILVTTDGQPKVVDFGTAALLQPERLTTMSHAPLTPAYASPEQLTGRPVGTATDQYSLGLVLYELVSGASAHPPSTSLIAAVERALGGTETTPAHRVVTSDAAVTRGTSVATLGRQLAGDLGTIVHKAIANQPEARYESVGHLIEDLYRWLRMEPIRARPASRWYRAACFVSRHRVAVATAAVLLVSLLVATAVSIRQATLARQESERARELNAFLTRMLSSANPSWINPSAATAESVTVRQVLDGAGNLIAGSRLSPSVEAEMRLLMGLTYASLGVPNSAHTHLERALAIAQASGETRMAARAQGALGYEQMVRGDFPRAEGLLRQALASMRSDPPDQAERLAGVLGDLGASIAYQRPGDAEAVELMREAIAVGSPAAPLMGAVNRHNLAIALVRGGHLAEGEREVREALRLTDGLSYQLPERASFLRTLAVLLWQQGQYQEAEPLAREAVDVSVRTRPPAHPMVANNKTWWGRTLVAVGDGRRGLVVAEDAYAAYRAIRTPGHFELALPLIGLGSALRLQGRLDESLARLQEAEAILRKLPAQRDRLADCLAERGLTLLALGNARAAAPVLQESHAVLRKAYGDEHPLTRQAAARLTTLP